MFQVSGLVHTVRGLVHTVRFLVFPFTPLALEALFLAYGAPQSRLWRTPSLADNYDTYGSGPHRAAGGSCSTTALYARLTARVSWPSMRIAARLKVVSHA